MHRLLLLVLLLASLGGCSKKSEPQGMAAPVAESKVLDSAPAARRTLAYQHTLALEVPEDKVATVFAAGQAACLALKAQCTLMRAQVRGTARGAEAIGYHETASAELAMRALPAAIPKLVAAFGTQATVTMQSTTAEELAGPLEDGAKKIALLTDYRDKLEALRVRAAVDIDNLIKVNHELAQVQGELEAAAGAQAGLQRRVDTELLEVTITSQSRQTFWRPIAQSLSAFSGSLSQGTASAISGAAYLLPWLVLLTLVVWIGRKLWRRRK
jgi:hypothetical protein